MSSIQSILFSRKYYTPNIANHWLMQHNFFPIKTIMSEDFIHARLRDPKVFRKIRTVSSTDHGVEFRIGFY
jgi:hypothetical protein